MAPTQSSRTIILNRQVTVVDLGLVSHGVSDEVDIGCSAVGQAFGRQPQKLPSSLHYVLRLRGGGSTAASLSGGSVDDDGDVSGAASHVLADETVGSGVCDDQDLLHGGGGDAVRVASAGVIAKEAGGIDSGGVGHVYPIFIGGYRRQPRVESVLSPFDVDPCPGKPEFRPILYGVPPVTPRDVLLVSNARSSSDVDEAQVGSPGRSSVLDDGAFRAPEGGEVDAGKVKEELAVQSSIVYRSASYTPSVRRPVTSCSPSVSVGPPYVDLGPGNVSVDEGDRLLHPGLEDLKHEFDEILVQCYGCPNNGRQLIPACTPLYNKFAGRLPAVGFCGVPGPIRFRNISAGRPAITSRLHVGEVVRFQNCTSIHNLEGRQTNTFCFTRRVKNVHHEGRNYFAPGCIYNPPLPRHVRIDDLDTCNFKWCSVDSVAFHSFAWPRNAREAKSIARTLFTNHCNWADVLIVRGRCFSTSSQLCFRANRVLENLLWNLSKMGRPYVVYPDGSESNGGGDLVPAWLSGECVYQGFCHCNMVSLRHQGWHHLGALYSNIVSRRHQLFEGHCGCSHDKLPFPRGCNRNTKNVEIAIKLCRVVTHVLWCTSISTTKRCPVCFAPYILET